MVLAPISRVMKGAIQSLSPIPAFLVERVYRGFGRPEFRAHADRALPRVQYLPGSTVPPAPVTGCARAGKSA